MFEKILYPTDFSDVAKKALKYIRQLKEAGAKEIVVLHVLDEKGIDAINRYTPAESLEIVQRIEEGTKKEVKIRPQRGRLCVNPYKGINCLAP